MQRTPFPLPVCPPSYRSGSKAAQQRDFNTKLYNDFWNFSVDKASQLLEQKPPDYWERKGEQLALELFHAAAERVPAYKDFLKNTPAYFLSVNPDILHLNVICHQSTL